MLARTFDWLMLALVVSIIFLFLRPGSQGVKLVGVVTDGIVKIMGAATGGGGWSGKK
jgi:hypothetical protein